MTSMSLLDSLTSILRQSGYSVTSAKDMPSVIFEDESILGLAVEFPTAKQLFDDWEATQDGFLQSNAWALRRAGTKSWNVYCAFLSADGDVHQALRAALIEENFRGARKLVGTGIQTDEDLVRAVLPLLPIQHAVGTRVDNARDLLLERLDLSAEVKRLLGSGTASGDDLIRLIATDT
jgi:hypothetical protein